MVRRAEPTPDQLRTIGWTASLGAVTAEALAMRLQASTRSARSRLVALRGRGLLASARPLAGRPTLFTVTRGGLRARGARGIDPCRVSPGNAAHLIACSVCAAALERRYPDHLLIGERELRRDERERARPLASAVLYPSREGEARLHRPDLVLIPTAPSETLPVAVEVELTAKAPARLLAICRAWARSRDVAGVLYIVAREVEGALTRAVAAAHAQERIAILSLEALPLVGVDPPRDSRAEPSHPLLTLPPGRA